MSNQRHQSPRVSIIVPVFNEERTLATLLERLLVLDLECEIIVVDNGSTDGTASVIQRFSNRSKISTLNYADQQGKGAAIRAGLNVARGEYVIIQDGDLEYDPGDIVRIVNAAISKSALAVFGSRNLNPQSGVSYFRYYWGGRLLTWIANRLFDVGITDEATCYKLVRRDILERMNLECVRFEFCPEVVAKLGLMGIAIHELPIQYSPRSIEEGKKIRWTDGAEAIWTLIKWSLRKPRFVSWQDSKPTKYQDGANQSKH